MRQFWLKTHIEDNVYAEFRFKNNDIPWLKSVLQRPDKIMCFNYNSIVYTQIFTQISYFALVDLHHTCLWYLAYGHLCWERMEQFAQRHKPTMASFSGAFSFRKICKSCSWPLNNVWKFINGTLRPWSRAHIIREWPKKAVRFKVSVSDYHIRYDCNPFWPDWRKTSWQGHAQFLWCDVSTAATFSWC